MIFTIEATKKKLKRWKWRAQQSRSVACSHANEKKRGKKFHSKFFLSWLNDEPSLLIPMHPPPLEGGKLSSLQIFLVGRVFSSSFCIIVRKLLEFQSFSFASHNTLLQFFSVHMDLPYSRLESLWKAEKLVENFPEDSREESRKRKWAWTVKNSKNREKCERNYFSESARKRLGRVESLHDSNRMRENRNSRGCKTRERNFPCHDRNENWEKKSFMSESSRAYRQRQRLSNTQFSRFNVKDQTAF